MEKDENEKGENIGKLKNIGGWYYNKHGWNISWYNLDNFTEDEFDKKWNDEYQAAKKNGEKGWKKIFNMMRYVHLKDDIGFYYCNAVGIAYRNSYSETSFTWIGKKNVYRFWIRYAPTNTEKGRWKVKFMKWHNDHVGCMQDVETMKD